MSKIIGIDLGTTNCCVATVVDGEPLVLEDERGFHTMPSYLTIDGGKFIVGRPAKTQVITNPFHTVYAIKRLIGRRYDSEKVALAREQFAFTIEQASDGGVMVRIEDRKFTPVEVSSIFLRAMRDIAANHLGSDIRDAIVTVPAYFNDNQRKQTKVAAEIAGLNVLRLVNEPTAAALAYGFGKEIDKKIVVFDLGGGTLDISVLEIVDNIYEVIATHGDTYLGGEDFDMRIVDYMIGEFRRTNNIDLRVDKMALQRLKDAAERAKIELSEQESTRISLPGISADADLDIVMQKEEMEILVEDLVKRCIATCEQVLSESGLPKNRIDDVILVGGMTRMPIVHKAVSDFFGVQPRKDVHPDEAIAVGAAILANSLDSVQEQTLLLDVTPLSLGIDSIGDIFSPLIPKNTTVPTSVTQMFTTVADNQKRVTIHVRQGESRKASENTMMGSFVLEGIKPAKRMQPQIEVMFHIDIDGILKVSAKDKNTGQEQKIVIQNYLEAPTAPQETQTATVGDVQEEKPLDEILEDADVIGDADEHLEPPPSPFAPKGPPSPSSSPPPPSDSSSSPPPPPPSSPPISPPPSPFMTSQHDADPDPTAVSGPSDPDTTGVIEKADFPVLKEGADPDQTAVVDQAEFPVPMPGKSPVIDPPLRLRVRYPDVEAFKREYQANIAPGEGFVETEKPFKVGTELIIETLIGVDPDPIRIMGTVAWINRVKPSGPGDSPQGMQIRYRVNKEEVERKLDNM